MVQQTVIAVYELENSFDAMYKFGVPQDKS